MTAWPIEEARRIPRHTNRPILFETGYGPSGLPHIGTFTEVARTSWVRQAFVELTGLPTKLIAFSDDMDALRRVPDNVPNRELLEDHLGLPLTCTPDPFETHRSFADHNNAKLREFLDKFGFDYEFASSTRYYRSGMFDDALMRVLACHDEIVDIIRPTLGKERAANYSPFMPIHPKTGHVMQVPIDCIDAAQGKITWKDAEGRQFVTDVRKGHCKLQWKADWAMRWYALGVDYEMAGKDLIDSVKLSTQICKVLGRTPPVTMIYELFLDEQGHKISKSKGNGFTMEEWLRYGPPEGLAHYLYPNPERAKKVYLELVPKATDEYIQSRARLASQDVADRQENPAWYIHSARIPPSDVKISFTLLMNLASVLNTEDSSMLLAYLRKQGVQTIEIVDIVERMTECAIAYYRDFIKPKKVYRSPNAIERIALTELVERLRGMPEASGEAIQTEVYAIGNSHFKPLKGWFDCLYQVLLGQTEGPRFGMFVELYGIANTIQLIEEKLALRTEE